MNHVPCRRLVSTTLARVAPLAAAIVLSASGCTHAARPPEPHSAEAATPPRAAPPSAALALAADSLTLGLWHFDENGGARVADSGPSRLDGYAGKETRTDFGRFHSARRFTLALDSFVYVPYSVLLDSRDALTVEAWVRPEAYGVYEDAPIAGRWTPRDVEHSWLFSIVGRRLRTPAVSIPSPGYHGDLVRLGTTGTLMFAYQPADAGAARSYFSSRVIELDHWTHVAVTFDGGSVRFYIDGQLDSQYAISGRIRGSEAPLMVGNFFDPRWLTDFGGDLRASQALDPNPYYAFDGFIDELRLSSVARTEFPGAGVR